MNFTEPVIGTPVILTKKINILNYKNYKLKNIIQTGSKLRIKSCLSLSGDIPIKASVNILSAFKKCGCEINEEIPP